MTSIKTDKFSTECIAITFLRPISSIDPSFMAILPYVLLRGSKIYPNIEQISKKLDFLYGAKIEPMIRKKGEFLCMTFVCDVIDSKFANDENVLAEAFEVLCEIIYNPLIENACFNKEIVESEKNNLVNRINGIKNDKRSYANLRMFEIMCKDEPFGKNQYGTVESVLKIDENMLYAHYNDVINNSQVEIFHCGQSDIKRLDFTKIEKREIEKYQENIIKPSNKITEIVENMNISQGKISIGFRTQIDAKSQMYPALVIFNSIFGGSTTSKLFENVREEMSLCYYASSSIEKIKGVMSVNSGIEIENYEVAKTAILKQFTDMQEGDFSNEDINSAKLTVLNNLNSAKDSKYALEDFYLGQAICENLEQIDDLILAVDRVSKQQIIDVANMIKTDTIFFLKGQVNDD